MQAAPVGMPILVALIATALLFDFLNGLHGNANVRTLGDLSGLHCCRSTKPISGTNTPVLMIYELQAEKFPLMSFNPPTEEPRHERSRHRSVTSATDYHPTGATV